MVKISGVSDTCRCISSATRLSSTFATFFSHHNKLLFYGNPLSPDASRKTGINACVYVTNSIASERATWPIHPRKRAAAYRPFSSRRHVSRATAASTDLRHVYGPPPRLRGTTRHGPRDLRPVLTFNASQFCRHAVIHNQLCMRYKSLQNKFNELSIMFLVLYLSIVPYISLISLYPFQNNITIRLISALSIRGARHFPPPSCTNRPQIL